MDNQKTWQKILKLVKLNISPANYGWFIKSDLIEVAKDKIVISVPTIFFAENITRRFLPQIEEACLEVLGRRVTAEFRVDSSKLAKNKAPEEEFEFGLPTTSGNESSLNSKYTLENFVVGPSNNVAYAAAQAVVQNPGTSYNPLFVYGGTGVGKTHLMLGIGNDILKKRPHSKVNYCSSEKFTNDYVGALQTKQFGVFRNRYRSTDILLIDDIQFFSGREGTQEEFFHTFNELASKNSQIVITSDRPPFEIAKLEDRLKSRFQGGLMVDMQIPDFDTRVAILKNKCLEQHTNLSEDSLNLIAASVESNARELEGKLTQVLQSLKTKNLEPSLENIRTLLGKKNEDSIAALSPKQVIVKVCEYFNIKQTDLVGPKRFKGLVLPRHMVMHILSEQLNLTVEKIGEMLGGRDHTTVMHGRDKIKKLILSDREVQRVSIEVKQLLSTG